MTSPTPARRPVGGGDPRPLPATLSLLAAAHPAPTLVVTGLSTVLAAAVGRGFGGTTLVAFTVLCGQLSIGWCNDYLDRDRDIASGRTDKPLARGMLPPGVVGLAAAGAAIASLPLSLANGVAAGLAHLTVVAAGWAYDVGLKRTLWSPLPYAVAFGLLPAFVVLGRPGHPMPPWWLVLAGAVLGVGAHFANAAPDVEDDLATDVRGMPQLLGRRRAQASAAAALVLASAVLVLGPPGLPGPGRWAALLAVALLTVLGVALPGAGRSRVPFLATMGIAVIDLALLLTSGATLA